MNYNEKISVTAIGCALRRAATDISYASELFDVMKRAGVTENEIARAEAIIPPWITPIFEARHKLIDVALKREGCANVFDLAAGLTPRGLAMTRNSNVTYVELDLPGIAEQKRAIVEIVAKTDTVQHPGLFIEAVSAMDLSDMRRAAMHFERNPIAIVHEGLFRYLSHDEKKIVIQNIKALLQEHGGIWITSDVPTKQNIFQRGDSKTSVATRTDIDKNLFETVAEAREFYEQFGFSIEDFPHKSIIDQLVSPQRLGLADELVNTVLDELRVFVMRLV